MRGIYAIVDVGVLETAHVNPLAFARAVLEQRPAALQLRAKHSSAREVLRLLDALAPLCKHAGVPLVNNDRVDIAIVTGCDMVHLGQDDAPIDVARHLAASLGVGLSTHTPEQLRAALASRPSYVAYGPIFATSSKPNHEPVVGLTGLENARAIISRSDAPQTPLVAIGGITAENAANVMLHADAIAVIGALVGESTSDRMRALTNAIGAAR